MRRPVAVLVLAALLPLASCGLFGSSDPSDARARFVRNVASVLFGAKLPPEYKRCVIRKAETGVSDRQLTRVPARELGEQIGKECFAEGYGARFARTTFVRGVIAAARRFKLSRAYTVCVVDKTRKVSDVRLGMVLLTPLVGSSEVANPATKLSRKLGSECLEEGVRP